MTRIGRILTDKIIKIRFHPFHPRHPRTWFFNVSNILRNYANSNRNKEQRVYQELKEYNFWRNLYGTKGIALVVYLLIIVREITLHGTIDIKIFFKSISRLCSSNINDSIRCDLCTIRQQANGYNKGV